MLARLPRLTSLTLNENDGLGTVAALAPLSLLTGLKTLEMRECRLPAVPASITALTSLQCLLLGYNHMTEVRTGGCSCTSSPTAWCVIASSRLATGADGSSSAAAMLQQQQCFRELAYQFGSWRQGWLQSCRHPLLLLLHGAPPVQRPPIPAGPYLAGLRVLAMSDARGLQDDQPFDLLVEPLAAAGRLEVLRINRCMGLQLSIEGECAALAGWAGLSGGGQAAVVREPCLPLEAVQFSAAFCVLICS